MAEAAAGPKKRGKSRKALKPLSSNDINISSALKENRDGVLSIKKNPSSKPERLLAGELQDLQRRMQQLTLEKEATENILKERDETLKQKEEELENRGREQERLLKELKKLQKLKDFKPTMSFPLVKSLREKEEEKKDKKKKDSSERKKPCPAYILWCKDQWSEVKKGNPDADFTEISSILGSKWKNIDPEEKKPYEMSYQKEKEAYLQIVGQERRENEAMKLLEEEQMQKTAMDLLKQYLQFKEEADKEGKKARKVKDPLKPKRPISAFFLFSKERRDAMREENKTILEIAKVAGVEWKNMTKELRAPYEEAASREKEEYERQMELYKQKKLEEAVVVEREEEEQKKIVKQEALQLLKKKERTENIIKKTKETQQKEKKQKKQNQDPNKPRRPASSFLLFSKEARKQLLQQNPGTGDLTLRALISVRWKELNEAEKQEWNNKAAEGMAAYKRKMEEYKSKAVATEEASEANPNNE